MVIWIVILAVVAVAAATYWLYLSPFSQIFGAFPYRGAASRRVVALTFDDGPNEPYTSQIAAILGRHNLRATFFQVGTCVERFPATTAALAKAGHIIGNHSQSHQFHRYLAHPGFERELDESQAVLTELLGKKPALFRPPWLWRQPRLLKSLKARGLQPVSGEFGSWLEPFQPSGRRMARRALAKVRPGSIIIFHDGYNATAARRSETVVAVEMLVESLLKQGYEFVTVDELLGLPAYQDVG